MRATVMLIASVVVVGYGHAVPIWGRVVDEECRPLPGAEVWLVQSPPGAASEVIGRDTSNANGTFVITGSSASATPDAGVTLSLLAYVEGRALGWWGQTGRPVGERRVLLLCDRATRTTGRVVDGREGGLGATVRPIHLHADGPYGGPRVSLDLPDDLSRLLSVPTAPDGSFLFTACPYHARAYLSAEHPEFGLVSLGYGPHCGTLVVAPPGRVRVRVTCAEAPETVAGLRVYVGGGGGEEDAGRPSGRLRARSSGTAIIGPDGVGEVDQVQPGRGGAFVYCSTDARRQSSMPAPRFEVLSRQTTEVQIALQRAVEVTGRVIDGSTGLPLEGLTVQPNGPATYSRDSLPVTDADGTYRFRALPGKVRASVVAILDGGLVDSRQSGSVEMTVAEGGGVFPDLVIGDGPVVEGLVVDTTGRPVPGAETWAASGTHGPTACDAEGRFTLYLPRSSWSIPGSERRPPVVTLYAGAGDQMSRQPIEVPVGTAARLVVEPGLGCRLKLRVTDPQGKPVPLAEVQVHHNDAPGPTTNIQRLCGLTEANGTYQSPLLWPYGAYTAEVTKRHWNTARPASWTCAPGQVHDLGDLVITHAGGVVAGRVVDTAGAAVGGAEVYASGEGPLEIRTRTDAAGAFSLDGLWEGTAWVVAVSPEAVGAVKVAVGEGDVILPMRALKPGARLGPPVAVRSLTDFATDRRVAGELLQEALRRFPPAYDSGIGGFETAQAMLYPQRVLQQLEKAGGWFGTRLAHALAQHGLDVVSGYLATLPDDASRCEAAVAGLPFMRGEDVGKLASAALGYARTARPPLDDMRTLMRVADALWEYDRPTAEELLRQIRQSARTQEPVEGAHADTLAHAAEALCRLDLPWSLEVIEELDTYSPGAQARLGIAGRIAATQPDVACRLIDEADALQHARGYRVGDKVFGGRWADGEVMRIAYAMAPVDTDRALALARGVESSVLRARALSYVAFALAPRDPDRAAQVVEEVLLPIVAALAAGRGDLDSPARYPDVMGDLTCVAYRIGYPEPQRVAWLALAARSSRRSTGVIRHLAFAGPSLAAETVRDAMEQSKLSATPLSGEAVHDLVVAATAVDANLAAELVRRLDDTPTSDGLTGSGAGLWTKVIELLATPPEDRQPARPNRHYLDWRPWARVAD